MSTRLKELINKGWVLSEDNETVVNPKTGRKIKVKTALSYPQDHPAYKAAAKLTKSDGTSPSSSAPITVNSDNWAFEEDEDDYGDVVRTLPMSAASDFEDILNKQLGIENGTADYDFETGAVSYTIPNDDGDWDTAVYIGPKNSGKGYAVSLESVSGDGDYENTYKSFKTPEAAIQYAAKLAKTNINNLKY